MIFFKQGDLLEVTKGVITHQVNMQGTMGAGLALQIRRRWPKVYTYYKAHRPTLGEVQIIQVTPTLWIANLCAQEFYGRGKRHTNYAALHEGLTLLHHEALGQIYIPYHMGCGLGGGQWDVVLKLIELACPDAIVVFLSSDLKVMK